MADYRAYVVGADGHFVNGRAFVCDNDSNATEWAKQLFDADKEVELWCGARLVARLGLQGQQRGDAVSHEILAGLMVPKK
jgi:hypothetical protein